MGVYITSSWTIWYRPSFWDLTKISSVYEYYSYWWAQKSETDSSSKCDECIVRSFLHRTVRVQENACDTHQNAVTKTVIGTTLLGRLLLGGSAPKKWCLVGACEHLHQNHFLCFCENLSSKCGAHVWYPSVVKDGSRRDSRHYEVELVSVMCTSKELHFLWRLSTDAYLYWWVGNDETENDLWMTCL